MKRRQVLSTLAAATVAKPLTALAEEDAFAQLLEQLENNPDLVEAGWAFREPTISRGIGKGKPSKRKLCDAAVNLIMACEIASPATYELKYRRPIWPKGNSGVTIGVGYDLRYSNRSYLDRDWPMLPASDRDVLASVLGLGGQTAQTALARVQAVDISWKAAQTQYLAFLPYPTGQTEDAFPNTVSLPEDSFGALVSLIYNRGPRVVRNSQSRREMYEIWELMAAKEFTKVPASLRSMKRLWTAPESRGLVIRREAEAVLFERGIASAHW